MKVKTTEDVRSVAKQVAAVPSDEITLEKQDVSKLLLWAADAMERAKAKDDIIKELKKSLWDAITEHCFNCKYAHDGYHHRTNGEQCQNRTAYCFANDWRNVLEKAEEVAQ